MIPARPSAILNVRIAATLGAGRAETRCPVHGLTSIWPRHRESIRSTEAADAPSDVAPQPSQAELVASRSRADCICRANRRPLGALDLGSHDRRGR